MAWQGSTRRATLPRDWPALRARILTRDPHCRIAGPACTGRSTEVDHAGDRHDHRPQSLRGVCHTCHAERTQAQAYERRMRYKRKPEEHPGILR